MNMRKIRTRSTCNEAGLFETEKKQGIHARARGPITTRRILQLIKHRKTPEDADGQGEDLVVGEITVDHHQESHETVLRSGRRSTQMFA